MDNKKDNQQPKIPNSQKYFLKEDTVYGNYRTIRQIKIQGKRCIESRWECLYIPTGEIKIKTAAYLQQFGTVEERDRIMQELVKNDQHQMGYRNYLYRTYKRGAIDRNIDFNLSFEDFNKIIQKNCYYCNSEPKPPSSEKLKARGNTQQPTFYHNGIDRIDPKDGYNIDNIVPCCSMCNYMKHIYNREEFFNQIIKIYNYRNLGSETISKESTSQANGDGNGELQINLDEDIVPTT